MFISQLRKVYGKVYGQFFVTEGMYLQFSFGIKKYYSKSFE